MDFPISDSSPIAYPGPPPAAADVVIIGGGIIGVCTALHLARSGQKVVLCEKGRIAGEQSSRNWGWIRQQARDPDELPIMVASNARWQQLARDTNVDIGLKQVGVTYMAQTQEDLARFRDWLPHAKAHGVDTRLLSREEAAALAPDMSRSFCGALHTASDMRAEPFVAVGALAGIAVRDGAQLVEDCAVRALDLEGGRVTGVATEHGDIKTDRVVICGGAWSSLFLRRHGIEIPQLSVRASACATKPLADIGMSGTAAGRLCWRRRDDGGYTLAEAGFHELFIGPDAFRALPKYAAQLKADPFGRRYFATAPKSYPDAWRTPRMWERDEISPFERMRVLNPVPNMKKMRALALAFSEMFPGLGPVRVERAWAGMIDSMPDEVPVVEESETIPGLIIGTGYSGHGFGIGPEMGCILGDLAMGKKPAHDISRFRVGRFRDGTDLPPGMPI